MILTSNFIFMTFGLKIAELKPLFDSKLTFFPIKLVVIYLGVPTFAYWFKLMISTANANFMFG